MDSYRASHVGHGTGVRYDAALSRKVDGLIWEEFVRPTLLDILRRARDAGATRYLDFACGTGRILEVGAQVFDDVTGIDVSPDMLEVARARVPQARILMLDVTREPNGAVGREFDCVSIFRFLLNAESALRRDVLRWLAAQMPVGATLVGNNHMAAASLNGVATRLAERFAARGRNCLTRTETEELLASAGFRVETWSGFRVLPSWRGRPLLGRGVQRAAERVALAAGLGRFGSDQLFVARRV